MRLSLNVSSTIDRYSQNTNNHSIQMSAWALFMVMVIFVVMEVLRLPETLSWIVQISILVIIFKGIKPIVKRNKFDASGYFIVIIFILYLLLNVLRGMYYAEGYWMWKVIFRQLLISLFYGVIILSTDIRISQYYYKLYFKYSLLFIIICFIVNRSPLLYNYLPFSTLLLFLPIIPTRKRWTLLSIVVLYFLFNYQRNDLVKILVSFLIGLYMIFYNYTPKSVLKLMHVALLIAPLVLLLLGSLGIFNVFKMDEYVEGDYTIKVATADGVDNESLTIDTRTFIYKNVYSTINKYDDWLIGRSPAFGDEGVGSYLGKDEVSGLVGRYGNEVGIMDIFLWYGLIGVSLYLLIYLRLTFLAIYKSNNRYAKGIGLYVTFIWMWSFIWEKPLFETFFMIDLILLGLCLSSAFRQMNDAEVKSWVKDIFIYKNYKRVFTNKIYESSLDLKRNIS